MKEGLELSVTFSRARALERLAPDKIEKVGRRETVKEFIKADCRVWTLTHSLEWSKAGE